MLPCCNPDNVILPLLPRQVVGCVYAFTAITGGMGSASTMVGSGSEVHPFADVTVVFV